MQRGTRSPRVMKIPTRSADRPLDGLLIVDKPAGWTSHDVVGRLRRIAHTRRVGHAGTLDPMATGVLVIGIGRATKLLTYLVGSDKSYTATIRLGQCTVTDDAEGDITSAAAATGLTDEAVAAAVGDLTGDLQQVPSAVSAVKIDGKRSYARVRGGEDVRLAARPVHVGRFEVLDRRDVRSEGLVDLDVVVEVSSGTYVRALARDLGEALGVGGHLIALRRTRVGRFTLDLAHELEPLGQVDPPDLPILPMGRAAAETLPVRWITTAEARDLRHGKPLASLAACETPIAALTQEDDLIAVVQDDGRRARSRVVFPPVEERSGARD